MPPSASAAAVRRRCAAKACARPRTVRPRGLCAAARPRVRLSRDGTGVAVGIMAPGNPLHALTYFSHFFEKPWKECSTARWCRCPTCRGPICRRCLRCSCRKCCRPARRRPRRHRSHCCRAGMCAARRKTILLMLTLAATLPLVIAMVKRPALYNGMRHFIFVMPPMAVLAGVAFAWVMDWLGEQAAQLAAGGARGVCLRPAVAARRDDPPASLSIHPLQPHRRHGAHGRQSLHA